MKKKIVGIFICFLLITISVLPVMGKVNIEMIDIKKPNAHPKNVFLDDAPLWDIGDFWIYEINDIAIEYEYQDEFKDIEFSLNIDFDNLKIEVVEVTVDSYKLEFEAKINGRFTIALDMGNGPIEFKLELGRIIPTKISGDMICSKSNLGIKELNTEFSGILNIKITEQPFIQFPIPSLLIPVKINLESGFSTPFSILDFPMNIDNTWFNPTTNYTILGGEVKSLWLRPINFIHKIMRFLKLIPIEYLELSDKISEILPVIYIKKVLEMFNVTGTINILRIIGLYCERYEEIIMTSGTFETYNISIVTDAAELGNIYYSPDAGKLIKIFLDGYIISQYIYYFFNEINIDFPDINIELIETNYS